MPILENIDSQSNVKNITGEHKRESTEKDRAVMVEELKKTMFLQSFPVESILLSQPCEILLTKNQKQN